MSTNRNAVPDAPDAEDAPVEAAPANPTRDLLANAAGWLGLVLLVGYLLYWGVTGNNFDLPAKVALILALLALGAFGLLNPQGILDIVTGRATRNIFGTAVLIALVGGILVAVNFIYGELGKREPNLVLRTDVTETGQYSLSPQSIKTVRDLTAPVTAYAFFGTQAGESASLREAQNLLKEYTKYGTNLKVEIIDPDREFGRANQYGLTRRDVVVFDNGTRHETANSNTEEDFTGALLRLRNNTVKKVAFLNVPSILSLTGAGSQQTVPASIAGGALTKEDYTVLSPINVVVSTTLTPRDVDVIIVPPSPESQPLSDVVVRTLLSYLDAGGHVLLIGDPLAAPLPAAIMQKYGLQEKRGLIIEQNRQLLWGQSPWQMVVAGYPGNTVTRDMGNIPTIYDAAEPIVITTTEGFTTSPMLQSSPDAVFAVISGTSALQIDPNGPKAPLNLGVTVEQTITETGNFTSTETTKPLQTRLAVVTDAGFLSDQLIQQPVGNLDLFKNTVNWLSQSEERISIRPQDTTLRQIFLDD
ncbi:MAG TPA: Gldg family protein, partial [Chloroflexia bacterium]|nr:Gldg family protein [Chloroflexia bacterium]